MSSIYFFSFPSTRKHTLSLLVHLDASEMLKHFTRDGKPLKKELKSLLRQVGMMKERDDSEFYTRYEVFSFSS